jgi:hypothetical protein
MTTCKKGAMICANRGGKKVGYSLAKCIPIAALRFNCVWYGTQQGTVAGPAFRNLDLWCMSHSAHIFVADC